MRFLLTFSCIILFQQVFAQVNVRHILVNGSSSIQFIKASGAVNSVIQTVDLIVEYNGVNLAVNDTIKFKIVNNNSGALNPKIDAPQYVIVKDSFTLAPKRVKIPLKISTDAATNNPGEVSFDIMIANQEATTDGKHHVSFAAAVNTDAPEKVQIVHLYNPDTVNISPLINANDITERRQYKLRYRIKGKLDNDSTVKLSLLSNSGSSVHPVLKTSQFTIPAAFTKPGEVYEATVQVNFDINSVKNFSDDEYLYVSFENDSVQDVIKLTRKGMFNPNKPFWVEIGSNFDFADGLKPNNFFGGVFFHGRDIRSVFSRKNYKDSTSAKGGSVRIPAAARDKNFAVFAGVFESKTISNSNEVDFGIRQYYTSASALPGRADSLRLFRDTGKIALTTTVRNIGLFFSPQVRLTNGSANTDGFHVFASVWLELQWQRINSEFNFSSQKGKDTLLVAVADLPKYLTTDSKTEADVRTHYFGLGLPLYYRNNDVNVYFNPVIGISNQPVSVTDYTLKGIPVSAVKRDWNPFYVFQFRLNEETYGISFTGEVRGLLKRNSPPFVSLALSKKFDLKKFIEFK